MSEDRNVNVVVREKDDTPEATTERELPTYVPRVDIRETTEDFVLDVEMPGVTKKGVDLRFERDRLVIEGRVESRQTEDVWYRLREYGVGNFAREFRVGETVDPGKIQASMNNGLLTVRLPKRGEAKPRRIDVG
jgi:HSP20 family protein